MPRRLAWYSSNSCRAWPLRFVFRLMSVWPARRYHERRSLRLYSFIGNLPDYRRRRDVQDFADAADRREPHHLPVEHLRERLMSNACFDAYINFAPSGFDDG